MERNSRDGDNECRDFGNIEAQFPGSLGVLFDAGNLSFRGVGCANRANGTDGALHGRGEVSHLVLGFATGNPNPAGECDDCGDGDAHDKSGEEEQETVQINHGGDRPHKRERASHGLYEALGENRAQEGRVASHAGH